MYCRIDCSCGQVLDMILFVFRRTKMLVQGCYSTITLMNLIVMDTTKMSMNWLYN